MRRFRFRLPVLAALLFATFAFAEPTQEQPKLPTITLTIGKAKLTAEVADDDAERSTGLMFRKSLGENEGMLFVMEGPGPVGFWMRNTKIPLSIAYINPEGIILEIHDLEPLDETTVSSEFTTILYGLEVPRGWFQKHGILPGDEITGLPVPVEQ